VITTIALATVLSKVAAIVTSIHHLPVLIVKHSVFEARVSVLAVAAVGTMLLAQVPELEVPTTFQNFTAPATLPDPPVVISMGARQATAVLAST
jgi:hypothetical protein